MSILLTSLFTDDYLYKYTDKGIKKKNINKTLDEIYNVIIDIIKKINIIDLKYLFIDYVALNQTLSRYSRDIYGVARMHDRIDTCSTIGNEKKEELKNTIKEMGIRVNSGDPYIYKQLAFFTFWMTVLKPFHYDFKKDTQFNKKNKGLYNFFNESIVLILVKGIIKELYGEIIIPNEFRFLRCLRFRHLTMYSLELFLLLYVMV